MVLLMHVIFQYNTLFCLLCMYTPVLWYCETLVYHCMLSSSLFQFPTGFHGHFMCKSRPDFGCEFRHLAKPAPPRNFMNRMQVSSKLLFCLSVYIVKQSMDLWLFACCLFMCISHISLSARSCMGLKIGIMLSSCSYIYIFMNPMCDGNHESSLILKLYFLSCISFSLKST